jgi:hypothetical protein
MTSGSTESLLWRWLLLLLVILSCLLVSSRGTLDVHTWERWTQDFMLHGPRAGYAISQTDYPPLMAFVFYLFTRCLSTIGVGSFLAIKLAVLVFEFLAAAMIFCWTNSYRTCAFFLAAFFLDAVLLGYSDVILGFFLLATFFAALRNQLLLTSLASVIAIFIKWQALIVMPFLLVFVLSRQESLWKILWQGAIPALGLTTLIVVWFDPQRLWFTLHWAVHHAWLSANAENFPWLLTWAYRTFSPEIFGGLIQGEITYIATNHPPPVFLLSRAVFLLCYVLALLAFLRSRQQPLQLLQYSLLGYLVYFVFNLGVHENHLFLAVILSILLADHDTRWRTLAVYLAIAFNLNLLFSYGLTGHASLPHVLFQTVDISIICALLNTAVCIALCDYWIIKRSAA